MIKPFLFSVAVMLTCAQGASADISRIPWTSAMTSLSEADETLQAQLVFARSGAPGYLANPVRGTLYSGAGVYFEQGAYLAAFPDVHPDGYPDRVLVFSDTGLWAYVRAQRLIWEKDLPSDDVGRMKVLVETAPRILPLTTRSGTYQPQTRSCGRARQFNAALGVQTDAYPALGIEQKTFDFPSVKPILFPAGQIVRRNYFSEENGYGRIEIIEFRPCTKGGAYHYDLSIDGLATITLAPESYVSAAFPVDRLSNRAVISCTEHRNSYFDYLLEAGVPVVWLPLVAAMTARWHSFENFDTCTLRGN